MDDDKLLDQRQLDHLAAIRVAFANGRHQEVLENFEQLAPLDTLRSGIRVEAIALSVRTHIALGDKTSARGLLKQIWEAPQKSHRLYRYAAIACLEFGEYRRARSLVAKAIELSNTDPLAS